MIDYLLSINKTLLTLDIIGLIGLFVITLTTLIIRILFIGKLLADIAKALTFILWVAFGIVIVVQIASGGLFI